MSSDDRRAQILRTACELFAQKGFRGTTTRELASAVGVTEPVLYEHFKTKRDLYSAIIENEACGGIEVLSELRARFAGVENDVGFFQGLAEAMITWYTEDQAFIRLLLFSNLEGHELKDLFHERSIECFHIVEGYIRQRQGENAFRADIDPAIAARGFFGMVAHYAMTAVLFGVQPLPLPPVEAVGEMARIFVRGMCTSESNTREDKK
jgi:AcrR family transcriptional regulator